MACGSTILEPGLVGDEYFMTKGHFHQNPDGPEYYVTCSGEGALILMDRNRNTRWEPMRRGSIHYVPEGAAHRVANTGSESLAFFSCWPSDIGHDYETIRDHGFSARLRRIDGSPKLVPEP
jgi:glucose-6-phosphate isomerase